MTKEDEGSLLRWLQDKDISEVMDLLMNTVIGIAEGY